MVMPTDERILTYLREVGVARVHVICDALDLDREAVLASLDRLKALALAEDLGDETWRGRKPSVKTYD